MAGPEPGLGGLGIRSIREIGGEKPGRFTTETRRRGGEEDVGDS